MLEVIVVFLYVTSISLSPAVNLKNTPEAFASILENYINKYKNHTEIKTVV